MQDPSEETRRMQCELFLLKVRDQEHYEFIKKLMQEYKNDKTKLTSINLFMRLVKFIKANGAHMLDDFNKCLIKEAIIPKKQPSREKCKEIITTNQNSGRIIDKLFEWFKPQTTELQSTLIGVVAPPSNKNPQPVSSAANGGHAPQSQSSNPKLQLVSQPRLVPNTIEITPAPPIYTAAIPHPYPYQAYTIEELDEEMFLQRMKGHPLRMQIAKIQQMYLDCIISLPQLKRLLQPVLEPAEYHFITHGSAQIQTSRRKGAYFVPLNELPETYFEQRLGKSYVRMPKSYASKCNDGLLSQEIRKTLNKIWVSVPLGSQHESFITGKKNQFEYELFKNEEMCFQVDHTIIQLRRGLDEITKIEEQWIKRMSGSAILIRSSPLLQQLLLQLYGTREMYTLVQSKPGVCPIVRNRVEQKLRCLQKIKHKTLNQWEDAGVKNFHKSLDHRSICFKKHDKKFNCVSRWDKEVEIRENIRKGIVIADESEVVPNINQTLNSFENITRQKLIETRVIPQMSEFRSKNVSFPVPPQNKPLFVLEFPQAKIFHEILCIIYSHVSKKNLFQYLVMKMFKIDVKKLNDTSIKGQRAASSLRVLDGKPPLEESLFDQQANAQNQNGNPTGPNERRENLSKKKLQDEQYFEELIDEQIPSICLRNEESPFEEPEAEGQNFVGTRMHYHFLRYLLLIYQRFIKSRESDSGDTDQLHRPEHQLKMSSPEERYQLFKVLLVHKLKDQKFEEYIHKLFGKNSFMFVAMDKIFINVIKLVNNMDDTSVSMIKEDMKDYDLELKNMDHFRSKSDYEQVVRMYNYPSQLFRFFFCPDRIMYVYSWTTPYKHWTPLDRATIESGATIIANYFNCESNNNYGKDATETVARMYESLLCNPSKSKIKASRNSESCMIQESEYLTLPNSVSMHQMSEEICLKRRGSMLSEEVERELSRAFKHCRRS